MFRETRKKVSLPKTLQNCYLKKQQNAMVINHVPSNASHFHCSETMPTTKLSTVAIFLPSCVSPDQFSIKVSELALSSRSIITWPNRLFNLDRLHWKWIMLTLYLNESTLSDGIC